MTEQFSRIFGPYREMSVRYDRNQEALWCYFRAAERPCFTPVMLKEFRRIQQAVVAYFEAGQDLEEFPIRYMILASQTPGVFNLGGDLNLFIELSKRRNRQQLLEYAACCVDICYANAVNLDLPLTTVSLVQGTALGGGFESAISSNYLIAEKHSLMGIPEIRCNLFPGMGGYSFLARRVGMVKAEQMITSGHTYCGSELYKMGIIDILAESGTGYNVVDCFIRKHRRSANGLRAIQKVKQLSHPVTHEELMDITNIWVDVALHMKESDLKEMDRLVRAGNRGHGAAEGTSKNVHLIRTRQDRRITHQNATFPLIDNHGIKILYDRRSNYDRRAIDVMQVVS